MGERGEPGYRTHYHEEDAYATEDVVLQYWKNPDRAFFLNPGVCANEYGKALKQIGVSGNG